MANGEQVRIGNCGRLVIPREVRRELNLEDGDYVNLRVVDGRIVITPPSVLLSEFAELTKNTRDAEIDVVQELLDERGA